MRYRIILTRIETNAVWVYHTVFSTHKEAFKTARQWDNFYKRKFIYKFSPMGLKYKLYSHESVRIWSAKISKAV